MIQHEAFVASKMSKRRFCQIWDQKKEDFIQKIGDLTNNKW